MVYHLFRFRPTACACIELRCTETADVRSVEIAIQHAIHEDLCIACRPVHGQYEMMPCTIAEVTCYLLFVSVVAEQEFVIHEADEYFVCISVALFSDTFSVGNQRSVFFLAGCSLEPEFQGVVT